MKHYDGFTLIEVQFVLAVLSVLILISTPLTFSALDKKTEETFIETLEMDLLYMQSLSSNSKKRYKLHFDDPGFYTVQQSKSILRKRAIPAGWQVDTRTLNTVAFNQFGTIREAGTFAIHTLSEQYNVICPLGKGRCYIEKQ
ncbi:competence type IV pilus minor pilin ComGD [Lentibacillus amyloliquefaciens]|uniref:Competence protein ComG n=1 Tax=Lentibacillus amyloliquefaciens TaxID=1472767 RepID=A0A0U4EBY0_9BACI|nr:competence type IV pilus minor pilin ComGD [Lentibacillus amyloliquefaciens]ALX48073.1 hypothetical protein AOX59_05305 [Lentibacillus amyloliquefaciens]